MKFAYSIIYVADVPATIDFYEKAFGMKRLFVHESNEYGEMDTGGTTLAFSGEALAEMNDLAIRPNRSGDIASGFELAFVTDDSEAAFEKAVAAGASPVKPPVTKPWGQLVGYVRDLNGCLIELCSPIDR